MLKDLHASYDNRMSNQLSNGLNKYVKNQNILYILYCIRFLIYSVATNLNILTHWAFKNIKYDVRMIKICRGFFNDLDAFDINGHHEINMLS